MNKSQAGQDKICWIENQAGLQEVFRTEGQAGLEEGFKLDGQVGHEAEDREGCNIDGLSNQEVEESENEILAGNEESPARQEVEGSDLEHEQSRLDTTCSDLKNSDSIVLSSMPSRILMILSMMLILHAMMLHL